MLLFPCILVAQESGKKLRFNAGLKVGFQAVTYNDPEFAIEGYTFDSNNIQSNRIGYTLSPFFRISKGRFYLQTEGTFGISHHNFNFKDLAPMETGNTQNGNVEYELTTYCLQVPILLGYNFVQQGKYGMSIFTGPRTKFIFTPHTKQEFKHFRYDDLEEAIKERTYYWEFGLGVRIHNVFFDFVYDLGLTNVTEHIEAPKIKKRFKAKRKDNILSFSVGMIF